MLMLAYIASGWSAEPEGQKHGAVFALDGKYAVSLSFNGPDRDFAPPPWSWRPGHDIVAAPMVHAEVNGLRNLRMVGVDPARCVLFVSKKPCFACEAALEEARVPAAFWLQDVGEDRGQWVRP